MGVLHEVAGATVGAGLGNDLPVTEGLDLRLDVADGGTKVTDSESALCFSRGEALAVGEVVHDLTTLGGGVAHNGNTPNMDAVSFKSLGIASVFLDSTVYIIQEFNALSTLWGNFSQ